MTRGPGNDRHAYVHAVAPSQRMRAREHASIQTDSEYIASEAECDVGASSNLQEVSLCCSQMLHHGLTVLSLCCSQMLHHGLTVRHANLPKYGAGWHSNSNKA